jgi:hypothetical protein
MLLPAMATVPKQFKKKPSAEPKKQIELKKAFCQAVTEGWGDTLFKIPPPLNSVFWGVRPCGKRFKVWMDDDSQLLVLAGNGRVIPFTCNTPQKAAFMYDEAMRAKSTCTNHNLVSGQIVVITHRTTRRQYHSSTVPLVKGR